MYDVDGAMGPPYDVSYIDGAVTASEDRLNACMRGYGYPKVLRVTVPDKRFVQLCRSCEGLLSEGLFST